MIDRKERLESLSLEEREAYLRSETACYWLHEKGEAGLLLANANIARTGLAGKDNEYRVLRAENRKIGEERFTVGFVTPDFIFGADGYRIPTWGSALVQDGFSPEATEYIIDHEYWHGRFYGLGKFTDLLCDALATVRNPKGHIAWATESVPRK